jgi:hypothetical protein
MCVSQERAIPDTDAHVWVVDQAPGALHGEEALAVAVSAAATEAEALVVAVPEAAGKIPVQ